MSTGHDIFHSSIESYRSGTLRVTFDPDLFNALQERVDRLRDSGKGFESRKAHYGILATRDLLDVSQLEEPVKGYYGFRGSNVVEPPLFFALSRNSPLGAIIGKSQAARTNTERGFGAVIDTGLTDQHVTARFLPIGMEGILRLAVAVSESIPHS